MAGFLAGYIFDQVEVQPGIGHPPGMALTDPFPDAPIRGVLIGLGDLLLVKAVVPGFGGVQDGAMRRGEPAAGMPHIGIIDPHIVVHRPGVVVQKLDPQVSVLAGIVNQEHIAVGPQHPQALPGQGNIPVHILVPRRRESPPLVADAGVIVRIAVNQIHRFVRQVPQDGQHIGIDHPIAIFFRQRVHRYAAPKPTRSPIPRSMPTYGFKHG